MSRRITIVRSGLPPPPGEPGELIVTFDQFREWIRRGTVLAHVGRHGEGRLLVHRLESAGRPLPLGLALRAMCRGAVSIEDTGGRRRALTAPELARWIGQIATEPFRVSALLRDVAHELSRLELEVPDPRARRLNLAASPLYLRTDLSFGVLAGGSVGHIGGVLNELGKFTGPPLFLTTDSVPAIKPEIEVHPIVPSVDFWNFRELPTFVLNDACMVASEQAINGRELAFVYQRYSPNNYAGLRIARRHRVPFVLEYNGPEVWVGRHWGRPLKYEALTGRIERLNAASADLVVAVSRALEQELVARGILPAKILVNPNGVDPDRYRPDIDAAAVRARHGLRRSVVIGFIGTFGPWHGAEILARAFVKIARNDPSRASRVRLLMIGDGARMPDVRRILTEGGAMPSAVFTGLVPQEQGPEYLAACDLLASPHVENPDGTPFFGSPTKLFEYMAMGRGIVASDLGQIGEVLEHGRTGWLVEPGDVEALAAGLARLIDNPVLRDRLGAAARLRALERHTWHEHTRRTIERLQSLTS